VVKTRGLEPAELHQTRMKSRVVRPVTRVDSPALAHPLYPCVDSPPSAMLVTLATGADRVPGQRSEIITAYLITKLFDAGLDEVQKSGLE
jgi:hypothetical protein